MTSSIKPEAHNVSLRRQRGSHGIGNMHKKLGEDRTCRSEDMIADIQTHTHTHTHTHTQTDTLIAILLSSVGAE